MLIRNHRLLLILVALFFAAGHAHQVFGQFKTHHHHGWEMHSLGEVHEHEGGEHHEDHGDPERESEHMLRDHMVVGIAPAHLTLMIAARHAVSLGNMRTESMPEAPVAGIDLPPQLA